MEPKRFPPAAVVAEARMGAVGKAADSLSHHTTPTSRWRQCPPQQPDDSGSGKEIARERGEYAADVYGIGIPAGPTRAAAAASIRVRVATGEDGHSSTVHDAANGSDEDNAWGEGGACAASPVQLHWAVTGAFHAALWYLLPYAGPALSPGELWVWRSLLQLSRGGAATEGRSAASDDDKTDKEDEPSMRWACSDEVELLLRLSLRRPPCFTVRSLENAYGESLHLHSALRALEEVEILHWEDGDGHGAAPVPSLPSLPTAEVGATADKHGDARVSLSRRVPDMALCENEDDSDTTPSVALVSSSIESIEALSQRPPVRARTGGKAASGTKLGGRKELLASPVVVRHTGFHVARFITTLTPRPAPSADSGDTVPDESESVGSPSGAAYLSLEPSSPASRHLQAFPQHRSATRMDPARRAAMETELLQVLRAARGVDLRACAAALHRCCCLHHQQQQQQQPDQQQADEALTRPNQDSATAEDSKESLVVLPSPLPPSPAAGAARHQQQQEQRHVPNVERQGEGDGAAAHEEREGKAGMGGIPSRKRELMIYLIERRYLQVATSVGSTRGTSVTVVDITEEQEKAILAQCWDSFVGDCVTTEPAVRSAVGAAAELFQLITGNFGAGGVLTTMQQQPMAPAFVAAAPTTLLMAQQLRLLAGFVCHEVSDADGALSPPLLEQQPEQQRKDEEAPESCRSDDADLFSAGDSWVSAPRWWWRHRFREGVVGRRQHSAPPRSSPSQPDLLSTPPPVTVTASFAGTHRVRLVLFQDVGTLMEYRRALAVHRTLFSVALGATTVAEKLRAKDTAFLLSAYTTVTKELAALQRESARRAREQIRAASSVPNASTSSRMLDDGMTGVPNIHSILLQYGLRAQQLLQFTPLYRWYACLELLCPLLQSAHLYAEANTCLAYLLEKPVYRVYPAVNAPAHTAEERAEHSHSPPAAPAPLPPVNFPVYYRPQKRGEWVHRLALNSVHLKQKEKALAMLEAAHDQWCTALKNWRGNRRLRETLTAVLDDAASGGETADHRSEGASCTRHSTTARRSRYAELLEQLPSTLQRRCRLLRAIWPEKDDDDDAKQPTSPSSSRSLYHACMEYQLGSYLRRADVLSIERTLSTLHKTQRRWTPLPARHTRLGSDLWDVRSFSIRGLRDALDGQMWREPELRNLSAMPVEPFVMEHLLRELNRRKGGAMGEGGVAGVEEGKARPDTREAVDDDVEEEGVWQGLHCEGAWIAYAARVLLWDCYAYPTAVKSVEAVSAWKRETVSCEEPALGSDEDALGEYLWLTPFQEGPLDLLAPLEFVTRRRRLLEERLAFFERNPKSVLLRYAARHMRGVGATPREEGPCAPRRADRPAAASEGEGHPRRGDGGDSSGSTLLSCGDDAASPAEENGGAAASLRSTTVPNEEGEKTAFGLLPRDARQPVASEVRIPPELAVFVGDFPLLDILHAVPKAPLLRLLRHLYLSDLAEGYSVKFSGFPDLVLWRRGPANPLLPPAVASLARHHHRHRHTVDGGGEEVGEETVGKPSSHKISDCFRLVEVKSPHDTLSAGQITVNDCLRRCGFDVSVAHVVDVEAGKREREARQERKRQRVRGVAGGGGGGGVKAHTATSRKSH